MSGESAEERLVRLEERQAVIKEDLDEVKADLKVVVAFVSDFEGLLRTVRVGMAASAKLLAVVGVVVTIVYTVASAGGGA